MIGASPLIQKGVNMTTPTSQMSTVKWSMQSYRTKHDNILYNNKLQRKKWIKMINFKLVNELWIVWTDEHDMSLSLIAEVNFTILFTYHSSRRLLTVLILAVCRSPVTFCSPWVLVAKSIECPSGVRYMTSSIPVRNSDVFYAPSSCHVEQFTFLNYISVV